MKNLIMNKEKLINAMQKRHDLLDQKMMKIINLKDVNSIYHLQGKIFEIQDWIEKIKNGYFDND